VTTVSARPWGALQAGDGVLDPAGVWHRVTRVESGWIELDDAHAMPIPAGAVTSWDAMAAAVEIVAGVLGGQVIGHGQ
jgi:hypothetical protein